MVIGLPDPPEPKTSAAIFERLREDAKTIKTGADLRDYLVGFHSPTAADLILTAMDVLADNPRRADRSYDLDKLKLRTLISTRAVLKDETVLTYDHLAGITRWIELFGKDHASYSVEDYPIEYAQEFLRLVRDRVPRQAPWQVRRQRIRDQPEYGNGSSFQKRGHGARR